MFPLIMFCYINSNDAMVREFHEFGLTGQLIYYESKVKLESKYHSELCSVMNFDLWFS